ncbi:unnamed protein product [Somion occarium]|uniref:Cytidyltransferase-like domain-containing protein n=1 Tax=Somion occarium TaxID=3059160 RepID=A0ABP1DD72_9APHY
MSSNVDELTVVNSAVLITTLQTIEIPPYHLSSPIALAATKSAQQLRIVLVSSLFNPPPPTRYTGTSSSTDHGISRTGQWDEVQRLLTYVYVQTTKVAQEMGKILMDVDVLLQGTDSPVPQFLQEDVPRVYRVSLLGGQRDDLPSSYARSLSHTVWLKPDPIYPHPPPHPISIALHPSDPSLPPIFPVTALGGTFDHLHAGHKILLSMAAWITSEKLIIGVTDDILLQNKANKHVLEPLSVRCERTRNFLALFNPSITPDIVPITDVYGPTAWDPNIQALVVSRETLSGGKMIEKLRREKNLPSLKTFVIDVISSEACIETEDPDILKKAKMSSTFIRQWIVEQQQHQDANVQPQS